MDILAVVYLSVGALFAMLHMFRYDVVSHPEGRVKFDNCSGMVLNALTFIGLIVLWPILLPFVWKK